MTAATLVAAVISLNPTHFKDDISSWGRAARGAFSS